MPVIRTGFLVIVMVPQVLLPSTATAQVLPVVTTAVTVGQLRKEIDGQIESAKQAADLILFNAAVKAKDALDAWERTNSALLDKAFDEVSEQQKQLFANMRAMVDDINSKVRSRLAQAQQTADSILLTINTLPFHKHAFVTRYEPKLLFPGNTKATTLRISGPLLGMAKPSLTAGDDVSLEIIENTATNASFVLPDALIDAAAGGAMPLKLKFSYNANPNGLFSKQRTTIALAPWVQSPIMGRYTVTPTIEKVVRETKRQEFFSGRLSGKDKNVFKGVQPPAGWKFDLDRFSQATVRGDGGEAGRCQKIADEDRSENGVKIQARVDKIRKTFGTEDGWIKCIATLPIYRSVTSSEQMPPVTGQVDWYKDVHIAAPNGIKSWIISVAAIDGRIRTYNGPGTDDYFRITADNSGVIISPIRPDAY